MPNRHISYSLSRYMVPAEFEMWRRENVISLWESFHKKASKRSFCLYYDPQLSKELLAQAGYPNGEGLSEITLSTTASYLDLCKYIQQQLGLLGIKVKLDVNPPAALRENMAQGKSEWFRGSWIADYPEAENYLSLFYSPNRSPKGSNYTAFSSKEYDRLYEKARGETDLEKRIKLYEQMNAILLEEAPIVVLYYDQVLRFTQKNISGLEPNPMNHLVLKYVKKH